MHTELNRAYRIYRHHLIISFLSFILHCFVQTLQAHKEQIEISSTPAMPGEGGLGHFN